MPLVPHLAFRINGLRAVSWIIILHLTEDVINMFHLEALWMEHSVQSYREWRFSFRNYGLLFDFQKVNQCFRKWVSVMNGVDWSGFRCQHFVFPRGQYSETVPQVVTHLLRVVLFGPQENDYYLEKSTVPQFVIFYLTYQHWSSELKASPDALVSSPFPEDI